MNRKARILLLSDDLRTQSGVARVSKMLIEGSCDRLEWIQIAVMPTHPQAGQEVIVTFQGNKVKLYPCSGFRQPDLLRSLLKVNTPDIVMVFQDPRQWTWFFDMHREVRKQACIVYYSVWDNLPDPWNNINQYVRSDLIFCISRLTYGAMWRMLKSIKESWQVQYLPHGVNEEIFSPISPNKKEDFGMVMHIKKTLFQGAEFAVLINGVHQRRKRLPDAILSYYMFTDQLSADERSKTSLLVHSVVKDHECAELNIVIDSLGEHPSRKQIVVDRIVRSDEELNAIYNAADVVINISSEEGFGLTTLESLMSGTPIAANVTGGIQDYCGFRWKDKAEINQEHYIQIGSLSDAKLKERLEWGRWVQAIWSSARSCASSNNAPSLFQEYVTTEDVANAIHNFFIMSSEDRAEAGKAGREFAENYFSREKMVEGFCQGIGTLLENK